MLLAADSFSDIIPGTVCMSVGDPHAQPTPIIEAEQVVFDRIATTELPAAEDSPAVEAKDISKEAVSETPVVKEVEEDAKTVEPNEDAGEKDVEVGSADTPEFATQETAPKEEPDRRDRVKSPVISIKTPQPELGQDSSPSEASPGEETASESTIVPQVAHIDFGSDQRSVIDEFVIVFDSTVDVDWSHGDLVTLINRNTQAEVNVVATLESANDATMIRIRFAAGPSVESATNSPSLADGNYELTLNASRVSLGGIPLDGDGNGVGGDDYVFGTQASDGFFRLFGDQDGDRDVDDMDYDQFVSALLSMTGSANFDPRFDSDDDGDVDGQDYGSYLTRHQTNLTFV